MSRPPGRADDQGPDRRNYCASKAQLSFRSVAVLGECLFSASSNKPRSGLGDRDSRGKRSSRFPRCHSTSSTRFHGGLRRVGLTFSSPLTV